MNNSYNEPNWFEVITNECKTYPIPDSTTCIDVGANVGGFVEAHKDKIQKFFCVEPGSENVKEIESHHSDLINSGRLKVYNRAVYNKSNDTLKLKRYSGDGKFRANSGSNSTIDFQYNTTGHGWSNKPDEYEIVTTINFEDVIKDAGLYFGDSDIDLLKVDCEGAEYDFLIGKDLRKIKTIVMEIHNFLDCLPSKSDPTINQRYDLIQHISKTHTIVHSSGMQNPLIKNVIPHDSVKHVHGVIQFRRKM